MDQKEEYELELEQAIRRILSEFDDPDRSGLKETPRRVVAMYKELLCGYNKSPKNILNASFDKENYDEFVILRDIDFYSLCEHHLMVFSGKVHIGYVVKDAVVGISKLVRLVECYARRLQIQERMTTQISDALMTYLSPWGVGVVVEAKHLCMSARGVKKSSSTMITTSLSGSLKEDAAQRKEFYDLINGKF